MPPWTSSTSPGSCAGQQEGRRPRQPVPRQHPGECAAILEVVRCFEDDDITMWTVRSIRCATSRPLKPNSCSPTFRARPAPRAHGQDVQGRQVPACRRRNGPPSLEHLNGNPASTFEAKDCPAFAAAWHELGLLTAKKIIYCANVDETALPRTMPM